MWRRFTRHEPCPVCSHSTWCTVTDDGRTVRCMRIHSDKPITGRDGQIGWLHTPGEPARAVEKKDKEPKMPIAEVKALAKAAYLHRSAKKARQRLAESLGVSVESLEALRVGYGVDEHSGRSWTSWPCRDWRMNIVGIVRRYRDGSKKTYKNTRTGLFVPVGMNLRKDVILIVEGGSDTAAAATMGIFAIGRPSNLDGGLAIKKMIGGARCLVLGENDEKPHKRGKNPNCPVDCQGCGHCFPGLFGAKRVASQLGCGFLMPPAWAKDFRDMVRGVWV